MSLGLSGPCEVLRSRELLWHRSKIWASSCLTSPGAGGHGPAETQVNLWDQA